jgi:hypothetical protein
MRQLIHRAAATATLALLLAGGITAAPAAWGGQVTQAPRKEKEEPRKSAEERQETAAEIDLVALDRVPEACWSDLRGKRIYFAHGTLGGQIVHGVETVLSRKSSIAMQVLSYRGQERDAHRRERRGTAEADAFDRPGIFHAPIGHDGEPEDKIDAFEAFLLSPEAGKVDVALLKFSCADIGRSTDVNRVMDRYVQAVDALKAARPGLVIVHCTAPLREPDHGAKAAIKKAVGVGPDAANANRGRYNELLRKRFADGRIFDVARAESRRLDGTEETVLVKNERWPALAPEYGQGARELTEAGRVVLGREFLLALSQLCADSIEKKPGVASVPVGGDAGDE